MNPRLLARVTKFGDEYAVTFFYRTDTSDSHATTFKVGYMNLDLTKLIALLDLLPPNDPMNEKFQYVLDDDIEAYIPRYKLHSLTMRLRRAEREMEFAANRVANLKSAVEAAQEEIGCVVATQS